MKKEHSIIVLAAEKGVLAAAGSSWQHLAVLGLLPVVVKAWLILPVSKAAGWFPVEWSARTGSPDKGRLSENHQLNSAYERYQ